MPVFEYRGVNRHGKTLKGIVDADNLRTARTKLKKEGIYVTELKDKKRNISLAAKKKGPKGTKSVNVKDLSLMTRQLATLIKANIPLVDALHAVSEQIENPVLAEAIADIKNQVNEGSPFNKALGKYPNIFNTIYVSMCEAGEASGTLDSILMRLAEFTEAASDLRLKVQSAMTYPVIMLVATLGILVFLFIFVIPNMVEIFESDPELELPLLSQIVIGASGILVNYWYVLLIVIFFMYTIFANWKKTPKGKTSWDNICLTAPVFGPVNRMVAVSRFTRTLATLLTGGVPMLNAMSIVRNVVDNDIMAKAIDDARSNISEGESIAGPLKKSGQFPPLVIHMVSIGEKTGELENMLVQVSDAYEFQVATKIDGMTAMMTPVVLVIMGLVVGAIVFAIMIPMFEMTNRFQ